MKKSILISSLFVATALVSQSAMAEIKIRAGAGSSTYELGGDYITAKSTYKPATIGLTFSSDSGANAGYLDLSYSGGSGKHDGWTKYGTPSEEFKRSDFALTGGVVFLNQDNGIAGNVYVGIKTGTTTLGATKAALEGPGPYTPTSSWTEETFETSGVIFGGGASFPIASGRAGSVGVNVGLGIMGAKWKDNSTAGFSATADTAVGGSLGASYTFPFTSNFGVTADYKYHSYSYNFGTSALPFTVRERISTLGATVYAKF
ncbi:MAG TPA: hypothetical protein DCK83_10585 [Gallionellaceae bacterium]|nr:hypothetical protein [Gallionellaceae bacterium]